LSNNNSDSSRLHNAARAGWLYFIAGNTQDEIAQKLRVSRPTAQRLVALARSERLITFRFEHSLSACVELAEQLRSHYGLAYCDVVPTDPANVQSLAGVGASAASFIEQTLASPTPSVLAVGTGRTLRAAVDQIQPIDGRQHTLVALVGNIAPDGAASHYDVLTRLADVTKARFFPIPLPVVADSTEQRELLTSLQFVRRVHVLATNADVRIVGVGQMDLEAPQFVDGFISRDELLHLIKLGAVGEITGWSFDAAGNILRDGINGRLTSVPIAPGSQQLVVGVANGKAKLQAIYSALYGQLINGLITDEATAKQLIAQEKSTNATR
jgi:DNA-binding transcriptional regulator LsrR (DeoR family)